MTLTSQPSRRTLIQGAMWTVPAITVAGASPAFASSQLPVCSYTSHTVALANFSTYSDPSHPDAASGTIWSLPAGGVESADQVRIDVHTYFDENSTSTSDHYKKFTLNQTAGTAGLQVKGDTALKFSMTVSGGAGSNGSKPVGQSIDVVFSQPVRNLSFVITDIDGNGSNQWDRVFITHVDGTAIDEGANPFTATRYGGNVTGAGTTSTPWQSPYEASVGDENANGNVRIKANKELTCFRFRFRNVAAAANTNSLNLTQVTFDSLVTTECTPA